MDNKGGASLRDRENSASVLRGNRYHMFQESNRLCDLSHVMEVETIMGMMPES